MFAHLPILKGSLRGRSGVALPVALFGLVAVSLLVTSALITSSTEVALSNAHQDGTRALYAADGALEEFMAQRAAMSTNLDQRLATANYQITPASGHAYDITVAELFRGGATPMPDGSYERRETYSLLAQAQSRRGRSVGALVEVIRTAPAISFNIDSGLTLGSDATVKGSATISDGSSDGAACDSAWAPAAIRHAAETTVTQQGEGHEIYGAVVEDEQISAALMAHVLNGHSLQDLTDIATIRFGPMFDKPLFAGDVNQTATNIPNRWGCPVQLVTGCNSEQAGFFPAVAIDANGGTVDITGSHGQGVLVIRNGGVHIRGDFVYAGIIVVEGTLTVTGTPRLEGGVVAMGAQSVIDPGDGSTSSGNSLIRFNQCQIVEAQKGITLQSMDTSDQEIATPTFGWFEVVR